MVFWLERQGVQWVVFEVEAQFFVRMCNWLTEYIKGYLLFPLTILDVITIEGTASVL